MSVNLDLFNKPKQPLPPNNNGYLFSEAEREANMRKGYADCVDGKGKRLGRKLGDERYDKMMADIAALNDSRFSVMRKESAERAAELQAKFGQRLPKDAPIPEGKFF